MSPRPAASRHDPTACRFLDAATQLIDAYLDPDPTARRAAPRLRNTHFPAALDWLRVEDVIRLAQAHSPAGASKTAFINRWPARAEFIRDALVYAMNYRDGMPRPSHNAEWLAAPDRSPIAAIKLTADGLLQWLSQYPRSLLLLHMGPLVRQNSDLLDAILPGIDASNATWGQAYATMIESLGLKLRPGWTVRRVTLALQAMLDGFLLRHCLQPDEYSQAQWEGAGLFADTVTAFVVGVVDVGDGRRPRDLMDLVGG